MSSWSLRSPTFHGLKDYVPLLEYFFEENPFPSRADKVFLAKKSGMTYKQIHVWVRWSEITICQGLTFGAVPE